MWDKTDTFFAVKAHPEATFCIFSFESSVNKEAICDSRALSPAENDIS